MGGHWQGVRGNVTQQNHLGIFLSFLVPSCYGVADLCTCQKALKFSFCVRIWSMSSLECHWKSNYYRLNRFEDQCFSMAAEVQIF